MKTPAIIDNCGHFVNFVMTKKQSMTNIETWKDIPNYEGLYQISDLGRVKNLKRDKLIKLNHGGGRYLLVNLHNKSQKTFSVHRLVAITFLGNSELTVNHINGDRFDNRLVNLEYLSQRDNCNHYISSTGKLLPIGVHRFRNKYMASITINKKRKFIGLYDDPINAGLEYQKAKNQL